MTSRSASAIHILDIRLTFDTGHVLAEYVPTQGALIGQHRVGFVTKAGKACKSIPAHAQPVQPMPTQSSTDADLRALLDIGHPDFEGAVAVTVTAEPSKKAPRKSRKAKTARKGYKWQEFVGLARKHGLSMGDAAKLWNGELGCNGKGRTVCEQTVKDAAKPAQSETARTREDGVRDRLGNVLPKPVAFPGLPYPRPEQPEWADADDKTFFEDVSDKDLRSIVRKFLATNR